MHAAIIVVYINGNNFTSVGCTDILEGCWRRCSGVVLDGDRGDGGGASGGWWGNGWGRG